MSVTCNHNALENERVRTEFTHVSEFSVEQTSAPFALRFYT
jgi:hypothetical protein